MEEEEEDLSEDAYGQRKYQNLHPVLKLVKKKHTSANPRIHDTIATALCFLFF